MVMKQLLLKLLRDICKAKGQFIAITAVIAIGAAFLVGLSSVGSSMDGAVQDAYQTQNLADLWVYVRGINSAGLNSLRSLPGVTDVNGRLRLNGDLALSGHSGSFIVTTLPENTTINIPQVESGHLPQKNDECMLDSAYAKANNIQLGDRLSIAMNGKNHSFAVSGFFYSAEYIYAVKDAANPVPDHKTFGELFLSSAFGKDFTGGTDNEVLIKTDGKTDAQTLLNEIAQKAQPYGYGYGFLRKNDLSVASVQVKIDAVKKISTVFPIIFFLVAALITFISMSRQIESQRSQIAVLKALGARDGEILLHYLLYPVLTVTIGSAAGILLGVTLIPPVIFNTFSKIFVLPLITLRGYVPQAVAAVLLALLFGVAATWLSARGPLGESPAQAMRPKPPKTMTPLLLERSANFWGHLSYKTKLILRNIGQSKVRTVLSSIGIVGCVGLTITAVGMKHTSRFMVDNQFQDIERYQISATLKNPEPFQSGFTLQNGDVSRAEKSASLAVTLPDHPDADTVHIMLLETGEQAIHITGIDGNQLTLSNNGVIISQKYAEENGIHTGDSLKLSITSTADTETVTVRVAGICRLYTSQEIYADFSYLKAQGLDVPADTLYITTRPGTNVDAVSDSLRKDERLESVVTKEDEFRNYQTAMQSVDTIILLMLIASAALALTVVYNISSINIFERQRDLATLKVLGYYRREVRSLVFTENLIITAIGSVFGMGFGVLLYEELIGPIAPKQMMFPNNIGWYTIPISVALGFIFTLFTNFLLRGRVDRIDMVESLKSIE